jgi:hypothetical protein
VSERAKNPATAPTRVSSPRLRVGDVFQVPLDADRFGLGQVVGRYQADGYFFALFGPAFARSSRVDIEQTLASKVALLALSLDAKVFCGDWVVVGNYPVAATMPLPAFKEVVGTPDRVDVVDFSGERRRRAQGEEATWLPNRTVVAPVRLENALKAKHGLAVWNDAYGALEPSEVATTARLFNLP